MKTFNIKKIKIALETEFDISIRDGRKTNSYHFSNMDRFFDEQGRIIGASNIFELMLEDDHIQLTGGNTFTRYNPGNFKNNNQIICELIGKLTAYLPKEILRAKKLKLLGI